MQSNGKIKNCIKNKHRKQFFNANQNRLSRKVKIFIVCVSMCKRKFIYIDRLGCCRQRIQKYKKFNFQGI